MPAHKMSQVGGAFWKYLRSFVSKELDIPEEELEELRMLSTLEPEEICRLKRAFFVYTQGADRMTKAMFMDIPTIRINPLRDRVAMCFGYEKGVTSLDFPGFLNGVSLFNSHGKKEDKLKLAFRLQDFDDDGKLGREDLKMYLEIITGQPNVKIAGWNDFEIENTIKQTFLEVCGDAKSEKIEIGDFIRCMHATDFHTKLQLSL